MDRDEIISEAISLVLGVPEAGDTERGEKAFNYSFRLLLSRRSWTFFRDEVLLTNYEQLDNNSYLYGYRFSLPEDFARCLTVDFDYSSLNDVDYGRQLLHGNNASASKIDYKVSGSHLYTNANRVHLTYLHKDLAKAGDVSGAFVAALVLQTAAFLSIVLKSSVEARREFLREYEHQVHIAVAEDNLNVTNTSRKGAYGFGGKI